MPFLFCREIVKNYNSAQIKVKLNITQITIDKLAQWERDGSQEVISNRPIESFVSLLYKFTEYGWRAVKHWLVGI